MPPRRSSTQQPPAAKGEALIKVKLNYGYDPNKQGRALCLRIYHSDEEPMWIHHTHFVHPFGAGWSLPRALFTPDLMRQEYKRAEDSRDVAQMKMKLKHISEDDRAYFRGDAARATAYRTQLRMEWNRRARANAHGYAGRIAGESNI